MELESQLNGLKIEETTNPQKVHSPLYEELLKKRQTLPVWAKSKEILEAVKVNMKRKISESIRITKLSCSLEKLEVERQLKFIELLPV